MDSRPPPTLEDSIAAAQAWWREAGVDHLFLDEPMAWLADEAPAAEPPPALRTEALAPPPSPKVGGDPAGWPTDLAAFRDWWLTEPSLDTGGAGPRVPPRGEAGAEVMLLVPMPEADDTDTLLAGPSGRLLASFATAAGLAAEQVYLAAALPRHSTLPDWGRIAGEGYGEILAHHIALANPGRLIAFGRDVLPLLQHDLTQVPPSVSEIAIQGRKLPLLVSFAPGRLLEHTRLRGPFWQCWLDWTAGDAE